MSRIVGFGECMLRLSAPGRARLLQSPQLEVHMGGAELNTLASLSQLGHKASYISQLPNGPLGDAALGEIRRHGVEVKHILRGPGRMGLYFYEAGSNIRPAKVIYDRAGSSFSALSPEAFDWQNILKGADWLHLTGITPSLGAGPARAALAAARMAHSFGIPVSLDVNYRAQLWAVAGLDARSIMTPYLAFTTVLLASARDGESCFGIQIKNPEASEADQFRAMATELLKDHRQLDSVISTFRSGDDADDNSLAARLITRTAHAHAGPVQVRRVIDRIGAGDAFAAGYLHARLTGMKPDDQLGFALTAATLKHTIPGDINRVTAEEITAAMAGGSGGRVAR